MVFLCLLWNFTFWTKVVDIFQKFLVNFKKYPIILYVHNAFKIFLALGSFKIFLILVYFDIFNAFQKFLVYFRNSSMHFGAFHSSINPFLAISLSIVSVGYFVTPSPLSGSLIAFQAANGDILLRIFIFFPAQRLPLVFSQSKMTEVPSVEFKFSHLFWNYCD